LCDGAAETICGSDEGRETAPSSALSTGFVVSSLTAASEPFDSFLARVLPRLSCESGRSTTSERPEPVVDAERSLPPGEAVTMTRVAAAVAAARPPPPARRIR
jgi:hypothetical protein